MRKLVSLFFPVAAVMMAAGCSVVELEQLQPEEELVNEEVLVHKTFSANTESTRTTLDGTSILFTKGESLSVYDGTANREFTADDGGSSVSFSGDVSSTATEFYALTPYSSSTVFATSGSTVTAKTSLASEQEATVGSFENGANISAAKATSSDAFSLQNVLSVAKFTLSSAYLDGHEIAFEVERMGGKAVLG